MMKLPSFFTDPLTGMIGYPRHYTTNRPTSSIKAHSPPTHSKFLMMMSYIPLLILSHGAAIEPRSEFSRTVLATRDININNNYYNKNNTLK